MVLVTCKPAKDRRYAICTITTYQKIKITTMMTSERALSLESPLLRAALSPTIMVLLSSLRPLLPLTMMAILNPAVLPVQSTVLLKVLLSLLSPLQLVLNLLLIPLQQVFLLLLLFILPNNLISSKMMLFPVLLLSPSLPPLLPLPSLLSLLPLLSLKAMFMSFALFLLPRQ